MLAKKFDRSDFDSRELKAVYDKTGQSMLSSSDTLRAFIHNRYYPAFGPLDPRDRRDLIKVFRDLEDMLRSNINKIFRLSRDIEEKLTYSIAMEGREDHKMVYQMVSRRKVNADYLARAICYRMIDLSRQADPSTSVIYELSKVIETAGLYFRYVALLVLGTPGVLSLPGRDGKFLELDWPTLQDWAEKAGNIIVSAEPATPSGLRPKATEFVDAEIVDPHDGSYHGQGGHSQTRSRTVRQIRTRTRAS